MNPPKPLGHNWKAWGELLNAHLVRNLNRLPFSRGDESPSENGLIMYDRAINHMVVSKANKFQPLAYGHNSYLAAYTNATLTASAADTETLIAWTNEVGEHINIDDTNTTRINFPYAGIYKLEFSCELQSGNNSSKTIYIWPKKNGTNMANSTMVHSLKNSGESQVLTRSGIFTVEAGDYIEAAFSVSNTNLKIQGTAASSPYPAAPSAQILVTEVDVT